MSEQQFKREERYIVIKRKHLTKSNEEYIRSELQRLHAGTVECVVVESDWPEYETVWKMIEARVIGVSQPAPAQGDERQAITQIHALMKIIGGMFGEVAANGSLCGPNAAIAMSKLYDIEQALSAQREQPQGECKCSMSIRVLGDGCQYCNPELAAELAAEAAEDAAERPQGWREQIPSDPDHHYTFESVSAPGAIAFSGRQSVVGQVGRSPSGNFVFSAGKIECSMYDDNGVLIARAELDKRTHDALVDGHMGGSLSVSLVNVDEEQPHGCPHSAIASQTGYPQNGEPARWTCIDCGADVAGQPQGVVVPNEALENLRRAISHVLAREKMTLRARKLLQDTADEIRALLGQRGDV